MIVWDIMIVEEMISEAMVVRATIKAMIAADRHTQTDILLTERKSIQTYLS